MPRASVDASIVIDWGVASSALPGQTQSGDLHLVKPVATGVLLAVVDGLGHGAEAATAARTAVTTLDEHASESVLALLQRCHWALKGSRGVVMSLAFADRQQNQLTWAGVGNVECMLFHADRAMAPAPPRSCRSPRETCSFSPRMASAKGSVTGCSSRHLRNNSPSTS